MPYSQSPSPRRCHVAGDDTGARSASAAPWVDVLDAGAIAKLRELDPGGRAGLVARVVSTYATSLDRLLAQFGAARRERDAAALRHVAHTLKSSSASVGAQSLAGLCAEVEARLRDAPGDALEPRLDELAAEAARVLAAVRAGGAA